MKFLFLPYFILYLAACSNPSGEKEDSLDTTEQQSHNTVKLQEPTISPLSHATFVLEWKGITIYNDPTGGAQAFADFDAPDIILISDIHGDHMHRETLDSLKADSAIVVAPVAVADQIKGIFNNIQILHNGDTKEVKGIEIEAVPMYNLPETADSRHPKGRGNGYILNLGETRVYISGDTEDIEEMRNLESIDIAFVCMNQPYTMSIEKAAEGVLAFSPKVVYPYHYRGQGGLSDVEKFKELVQRGNEDIEVRLENWYANAGD